MISRPRLITAAVAVALLAACAPEAPGTGSGGSTSGNQVSDATLTIATTTDVVNYNPLVGNSRSDYWITNLMYPHLLSIGPDGNKQPELATKWGYDNPTSGYYEIKSGLKWSDGKPLTAKDVAFTLNATKRDKPAGTLTGQLTNMASATAVSDTRVEVKLSAPDSTVIPEVGFWGNIVPQHVFEPAGSVAKFANDGSNGGWVSAGPYVLSDVQRGQSYTMTRVDNYPLVEGGKPKAAKIVYRVFPDVNTEILSLKNGDVDVIANSLPPAQVKGLQGTDGIKVAEVPGLGYAHMTYNMTKPDLAKKEVRQALAQAVDYDAIRKVVLQDQGVSTGSSPIMPVLKDFYDDSIKEYSYDPAGSKKLLQQAGYTADGNGNFPLTFRMIYSLQDPVTTQWATLVKDGAAKAGITIELQGLERNTYLAKTNAGDFDIYAGNFAIMDDPATNMALTYLPKGAINYSYVDDSALNDLITRARVTFDRDKQRPILQKAAKMVRDNVYDNIMYTQNLYVAYRSDWSGFSVKPSELLSIVNPISVASATKSK
ncbi:ABC transporter substrate-binding protein [Actinophytocola sp.]|uniref:ABC transporter substrate-binding protein n=1 Tax=Actinophytocola sp. TaxID=1872138 RepID=UPI002D31038F|nr:ABC transporter substrate-binding protein [Actinophytocola sp.]HYQ64577.1 ABC transporter substrate-binding protein [Actinophytocola sp.]